MWIMIIGVSFAEINIFCMLNAFLFIYFSQLTSSKARGRSMKESLYRAETDKFGISLIKSLISDYLS
jgi:hypothetical protein